LPGLRTNLGTALSLLSCPATSAMPTPYQFSVYVSSNKGMYFTSSTPAAAPEGLLAIRFRCQQLPKKTKCSRRPARPGLSRPSLPRLEPSPTAPPAPRPSSPCSPRSSFPVTGLPTLRALVSPASSARAACNRGIDLFNDSVHRRFITAGVIDGFDHRLQNRRSKTFCVGRRATWESEWPSAWDYRPGKSACEDTFGHWLHFALPTLFA
jgi:hypothetical protein